MNRKIIFIIFFSIVCNIYCEEIIEEKIMGIEKSSSSNNTKNNNIEFDKLKLFSLIKDGISIIVLVIGCIIAILTFIQAKKSIFTPIKTEAFKIQLKSFEELLDYFKDDGISNFDKKFDMEEIVRLNAQSLYDNYCLTFFLGKIKMNLEKRNEIYKNIVGGIATKTFIEKNFELVDDYIRSNDERKVAVITNPKIKVDVWKEYDHGIVHFTQKYQDEERKLSMFQSNPLIPQHLKELIGKYKLKVYQNLHLIGMILTEVAKELPEKYPTVELLRKSEFSWIWHKFVEKRDLIENEQKEILEYINKYLNIEHLIERKK